MSVNLKQLCEINYTSEWENVITKDGTVDAKEERKTTNKKIPRQIPDVILTEACDLM
jgi:hypothetical protein